MQDNTKMPDFMGPNMWQDYLRYWSSEEYKKLGEKEKKARASKKGDSLHTAEAISQIDVEDKMAERARKKEEETAMQMKMMQEQISSFLHSPWILPPCPGDAARAARGLSPLEDYTTKEEDGDGDEDDEDEL